MFNPYTGTRLYFHPGIKAFLQNRVSHIHVGSRKCVHRVAACGGNPNPVQNQVLSTPNFDRGPGI